MTDREPGPESPSSVPTTPTAPVAPTTPVAWESPVVTGGPAPGVEYAPHGGRLVAYIIDSIIVVIACSIPAIIGAVILAAGTTVDGQTITSIDTGATTGFFLFMVLTFLIGVLYFPYFWSHGGQTPGMRPFSLRVVRDKDGGALGWGTAFLRLLGLWVASAVFYIGLIWIFVDDRRRGWQDLIAGTIVVKQP
jgi:uncharacterized RDD family membrane protein YckC